MYRGQAKAHLRLPLGEAAGGEGVPRLVPALFASRELPC